MKIEKDPAYRFEIQVDGFPTAWFRSIYGARETVKIWRRKYGENATLVDLQKRLA